MSDVKVVAGKGLGLAKKKHKSKHKHKHHKHKHHKHHEHHEHHPLTADYVIVGLGTSGATLARYLSDPVNGEFVNSVIVIESGMNFITGGTPADRAPVEVGAPLGDLSLPLDTKYSFFRPMRTGLAQSGFFGYGDSEGRMWAGSSAHNNMLTVRSSADVYDEWAADSGNPQWTYDNLLPLMKFMENYIPNGTIADPAQRGTGGPLTISQDIPVAGGGSDPGIAAMAAACAAGTNAPLETDYNVKTNPSSTAAMQWFSTAPGTSFNGKRVSSGAFLPTTVVTPDGKGVGGRKLTIISNANVARVLTRSGDSGPTAEGVEYYIGNDKEALTPVHARKKVILSAGAVATPAILLRSGIGDPALLSPLGIPVVVDNVNVGANLKNHYGVGAVLEIGGNPPPGIFQGVILNSDLSGSIIPTGQAPDGVRRYQWLIFPNIPGNGLFLQPAVLVALGVDQIPNFAFIGALLIPRAVGSVQIVSADPTFDPRLAINGYEDVVSPTDLERGVEALKVAANVSLAYTGTMPLWPPASHYPAPYPGGTAPDDSLLVQDLEQVPFQAYHLVGSCRMGTSIANGVVDANLNVFGIGKLAVCDNSAVPRITTGNTSYPAYLLGLKLAQLEGAQIP
jgi:choline dehydrogenase